MEELFRDFWWLIFPIWGLGMGAWHSMAGYRRQKAMLDLVRTYAEKGEQPPEALLAALGREDVDGSVNRNSPVHYWSLGALFAILAAGFGVGAWAYDFEGVGWPFAIVALVMAAVAVWSLINALFLARQRR
ncbi:MAG TPA: hypothetical protein VFF66_08215 [Brevundimonas sp.]|nr:hypothetical protein [Brevundimonas sp.]